MKLITRIKKFIYIIVSKFRKPKIEVYQALFSGNGSFIDIRYWLSRPDMVNPKGNIYIVHDESGEKLFLMKIAKFGAIRTVHNKYKNSGILLIYNRNGLVKRGSMITLHLDNLTALGVEVQ